MVVPRSSRALLWLACLCLCLSLSRAANFVVEKSTIRVKGQGFAASFPSAIGDVSIFTWRFHPCLLAPTYMSQHSKLCPACTCGLLPFYPVFAFIPSPPVQFGVPNYGAILVGQVGTLPDNPQGCSEIIQTLPQGTDVLLVDRGSCYFVEKAWHAQQAGAKAVVVADNIQETLLTMAVRSTPQHPT